MTVERKDITLDLDANCLTYVREGEPTSYPLFAADDPRLSIGRTLEPYWGRWLFYVKKYHDRPMKEALSTTLQALGQPDCVKIRFRFLPTPQTIWDRL